MTAPSTADIEAARLLLARLGVSPADLLAAVEDRVPAPTFVEYVPVVRAAVAEGTRRVYGSYWNRIVEHWGTRRLDELIPSEVNQLVEHVKNNEGYSQDHKCQVDQDLTSSDDDPDTG